jgi:alginate O-acetyltransferase complex protein AlgI
LNFNTLEFLLLFLPLTLAAFYAVPMRARLWVLVAASLFFYSVSGPLVLLAFVFAIGWGYTTAYLFGRAPKPLAVTIAVVGPAFFLVMFKYLGFILDTVHAGPDVRQALWGFLSITLPAGISFYTFEIVSYSIDVADKKIPPERSLLRFASFATFFPHLIAGPIMRYEDLRRQLTALETEQRLRPDIVGGLKFLSIGLFGKVFLADVSGIGADRAELSHIDQLTSSIRSPSCSTGRCRSTTTSGPTRSWPSGSGGCSASSCRSTSASRIFPPTRASSGGAGT